MIKEIKMKMMSLQVAIISPFVRGTTHIVEERRNRKAGILAGMLVAVTLIMGLGCVESDGTDDLVVQALLPDGFTSEFVTVDSGVRLHYVRGGAGQPLVLLHGFPETWYEWRGLLPTLAQHFTVIAPDLRGAGDSDAPADGYDAITLANDIRGLVEALELGSIHLVGHDVGLQVAYAYAAIYPQGVSRLALLDAPIPDENLFTFPSLTPVGPGPWHFGFFATPGLPESLIEGRAEVFIRGFVDAFGADASFIDDAAIAIYARNLRDPARLAAHLGYFRNQAANVTLLAEHRNEPLLMPVLAIGAEFSLGGFVPFQVGLYANDVTGLVYAETSHWLTEQRPDQLATDLIEFFGAN